MTFPTIRTVASLSPLERAWLKRRVCGFCECSMLRQRCGGGFGLHELPVIEGVRGKPEIVDLGPPCDMDERRAHVLASYKPRKPPIPRGPRGEPLYWVAG